MSRRPQFEDYPVRPGPEAGESLPGYCWRFFAANGHTLPGPVLYAVQTMRRGVLADEQTAVIRAIFGAQRVAELLVRERAATAMLLQPPRSKWINWATLPRHCPECVSEGRVHALLNDLPLVAACYIHGTRLVTRCGACAEPLSWLRLDARWRCPCGASIGAMAVEPAPQWQQRLAAGVQRSLPSLRELSDFYHALAWACSLRRVLMIELDEGKWPPLRGSAKVRAPSPKKPGRWEAELMHQAAKDVATRASRFLRRVWHRDAGLLICMEDNPHIAAVLELLSRLPHAASVGDGIHQGVAQAVRPYAVSAQALPGLLLHPAIVDDVRGKQTKQFGAWWQRVLHGMVPCDVNTGLNRHLCGSPRGADRKSDDGLRLTVAILNALLNAALNGVPPSKFVAFRARWHPPIAMFCDLNALQSIATALIDLQDSELAFVSALIDKDLGVDMR